jgi:Domain of unknown function (DUF4136)
VKALIVGVVLLGLTAPAAAQKPKYGVKVSYGKGTPFASLKTYAWTPGWAAFLWPIDLQVVTAVDRELERLGFVKVESQPSDVLVTYAAMQRTDVDLKARLPENPKLRREYRVGTLVVLLREPETYRELFKARADAPLAGDSAAVAEQIDAIVAQMFEQYPTRRAERR